MLSGFGLLVFEEVTLLKVTEGTVPGESLIVTVMEDDTLLLCVVTEGTVVDESLLEDEVLAVITVVCIIAVD